MKTMKAFCVFAALAAAMNAFAALHLKPDGKEPPYYWDDTSLWWNKEGGAWANRVPNNTEEVDVFSPETRESPLYITNGVNAVTKAFYLATTNATSCSPQLLTIDGGSLTASGGVYLGFKNSAIMEIKNGGSMIAKTSLTLGRDNDTSVGTKCITNIVRIADGSSLSVTNGSTIGNQRKGLTLIDNRGTINFNGDVNIGNCNYGSVLVTYGDVFTVITNTGTINANAAFRIGYRTNCVTRVENIGNMNMHSEFSIANQAKSQGFFRHSAGTFNDAGATFYIGYGGRGCVELAGDTHTILDKKPNMYLSLNNWNDSKDFGSYGELVITNSATLSRGGNNIDAATRFKYGMARIALYDDAMLSDVGALKVGNSKSDSSFEVYNNAVVSNVDVLVLNVGNTSSGTGTTTMKLSGNAKVCEIRNAYIGSNKYNHAELEIADNAFFGLRAEAMNTDADYFQENIYVAADINRLGSGTIRLRGGMIGLGNRGGLFLGDVTNDSVGKCSARLVGYGCVTNHGSGYHWSRIMLRSGSVTADGEGVARDLDLGTFARVSGSLTGESADGRSNINKSGTNGWYAINKGRLLYPRGDTELVRFVGDYARTHYSYAPRFVNSMRILLKDKDDKELTSHRKFTVYLYAPDRDDIPGGLIADDANNRRLGVWRGHSTLTSFTKAEMNILYDRWRLAELKNAQGKYSSNLHVCLYRREDVDGAKWKCITMYPVSKASSNAYRISGDLQKSGGNNLGWFAVVAKEIKGTVMVVR